MASIQKRPNGRWRARYRDPAGKEHARHFDRKVDAQGWLDQVTSSVVTGTYVDPSRARTLIKDVAAAWLDQGKVEWKATTRSTNERLLRLHVLPRWGNVSVGAVQEEAIQAWVAEMCEAGKNPLTVRKIFFVLSGVLSKAVRSKLVPVSPAKEVVLPTAEAVGVEAETDLSEARRYLEPIEVERLAEAAGPGRLVVLTLAYTGLRWGEMAALKVENINRTRPRITVMRSVTEVDGKLIWSSPKDKKDRIVPLPKFLHDELLAHVDGMERGDLVFTSPRGSVLRNRAARRGWFDAAVKECGLDGLTPHGLRHTAASIAHHAGAGVLVVQRMLGHKTAAMTLDVYSDLFDGDLDSVGVRMEEVRAIARADYLRTRSSDPGLRVVG